MGIFDFLKKKAHHEGESKLHGGEVTGFKALFSRDRVLEDVHATRSGEGGKYYIEVEFKSDPTFNRSNLDMAIRTRMDKAGIDCSSIPESHIDKNGVEHRRFEVDHEPSRREMRRLNRKLRHMDNYNEVIATEGDVQAENQTSAKFEKFEKDITQYEKDKKEGKDLTKDTEILKNTIRELEDRAAIIEKFSPKDQEHFRAIAEHLEKAVKGDKELEGAAQSFAPATGLGQSRGGRE